MPQVTSAALRLTAGGGVAGTADLTGYTWTGAVAHRYWMALDPSQAPGGGQPGAVGDQGAVDALAAS